jgi:hypothetical protein
LDKDGFLLRGRERAYVLGSVPPLPYYQIVASTGPWQTYLSYARVGPEVHARLESFADALDDEGRNALRLFVQATAQRSNLKAD